MFSVWKHTLSLSVSWAVICRIALKTCFSRMVCMRQRQLLQLPTWASLRSRWLIRHASYSQQVLAGHAVSIVALVPRSRVSSQILIPISRVVV